MNLLPRALLALAIPACAAQAGDSAAPAPLKPRPNILLVYCDDHAQHAISAYGSVINRTPNIDRIANEGMRFARSFVGNSICAPARATVLTGKLSHANGVMDNGNTFDGAQTTFPKLLRAAGYETALIGKWHLKSDPTGFDHWEVLYGQGPYYNPKLATDHGDEQLVGYTTDLLTDRALAWLGSERDPAKPFLLMLQHKAPHRNWQPGPAHLNDFDDIEIPEPVDLFDDWSGRTGAAAEQEMTVAQHLSRHDLKLDPQDGFTPEQQARWDEAYAAKNAAFEAAGLEGVDLVRWMYQRYIKDYLRCIQSVDDNVGRVLEYLDANGLADNTLVVYSSDQGFYLGDHGWYDKRWMYEESLSTPLIARWPGVIPAGAVDEHLVQNIDLAPTFLEAAGVTPPAEMQGRSLVRLLRGAEPAPGEWRGSIYYHYYEHPGVHNVARHVGVRTDRYKLIHFYQRGEWELFDLERDPEEHESVYADPAYADVKAELTTELERLRAAYGDATE